MQQTTLAPATFQRFLAWIMFGCFCCIGAVFAAPTPTFTATTSGTASSLTITADLRVGDVDVGKNGNIYLVAHCNDAWYANNSFTWERWQGGPLPVHASGVLADRSIEVVRNLDTAALSGTQVFIGYGLDEADMLGNGKYAQVYQLTAPVPVSAAHSSLPRLALTVPTAADQLALTTGNTAFALDLYRQLLADPAQSGGNLFFSPLSISVALAMTHAGARGSTAEEMAAALHFTLPQERLHPAFGWLDLELASRGQGAQGKDGQPFRLSVANSIWGDTQASFEQPFLDTLAQNYGAGINLVDFIGASEASRIRINDWVAEKTVQRIQNILPQGSVTPYTRMVLVNAVYFNAAWQQQFNKAATTAAPFSRLDGTTATLSLMSQTGYFNYATADGYQAVELPYDGGELSMLVVLPAAGQFLTFEQSFDESKLAEIQATLSSRFVRLDLPKFKLEGGFSVKAALQSLGMNAAFGDAADFSGIGASEAWRISDIYHKSFAEVDESGTEAAAATAVVVGTTSVPPEPVVFKADRPFLFGIVDKKTNSIVFWGRLVAP